MFPAQALAEAMLARGWRVTLSTDARGARYAGGFPPAVERRRSSPRRPSRGAGWWRELLAPFASPAGVIGALVAMLRDRPAVVVGFGGYPTIPALAAAWLLRRAADDPRTERRARPGQPALRPPRRRGRLRHLADGAARGRDGPATPATRCARRCWTAPARPISRPATSRWPAGDRRQPGRADPVRRRARRRGRCCPTACAARLRVSHQARPEDMAARRGRLCRGRHRGRGRAASSTTFPRRLAEAQLVISRAGASSVADITVIGRPSILVPYRRRRPTTTRPPMPAGWLTPAAAILIREARLDAPTRWRGTSPRSSATPRAAARWPQASLALGPPRCDRTAGRAGRSPGQQGDRRMNAADQTAAANSGRSISSASAASACRASPRC